MKLTTKTTYGIRALLSLATAEEHCSIQAMATSQNLSVSYLEAIFAMFLQGNIVSSTRGSLGGYRLCRPAQQITLLKILTALQEPIAFHQETEADDVLRAMLNEVLWIQLDEKIERLLRMISLEDMLEESSDASMYYI